MKEFVIKNKVYIVMVTACLIGIAMGWFVHNVLPSNGEPVEVEYYYEEESVVHEEFMEALNFIDNSFEMFNEYRTNNMHFEILADRMIWILSENPEFHNEIMEYLVENYYIFMLLISAR